MLSDFISYEGGLGDCRYIDYTIDCHKLCISVSVHSPLANGQMALRQDNKTISISVSSSSHLPPNSCVSPQKYEQTILVPFVNWQSRKKHLVKCYGQ